MEIEFSWILCSPDERTLTFEEFRWNITFLDVKSVWVLVFVLFPPFVPFFYISALLLSFLMFLPCVINVYIVLTP